MATNRILVYLDAPEVRRNRLRAAAHARCEELEERCRGMVEGVVDDDGSILLLLRDPSERDATPIAELETAAAAELRKLAGLALEVAIDLEGGGT